MTVNSTTLILKSFSGGMACFLKEHGCEHRCEDIGGIATCQCKEGFTLQDDQKHCKKGKS